MEKQDILLARQPIYDTKREIVAYELLFRESDHTQLGGFDGNRATSRVLLSLFTETDLATVTGGLPAFVNFTAELIRHPPLFDRRTIIIEVLEDIEITEELIANIKKLKQLGFTIALDDFVMAARYRPLLELVDIVKLELPAMNDQELQDTISTLKTYGLKLLAEKIETPEQFKRCLTLGCDMFQGYFLSKPENIKGTKLSANKLAIVNLISAVNAPEVDMPGLTRSITQDPSLSFKLLKLINSAAYRRPNPIESIHMAVTLLGIDRIKSWVSLLALSKIDDKPQALHYLALVRALVCERLAEAMLPDARNEKNRFYTVGLLSCLDAFFDQDMQQILEAISLESSIKAALLEFQGAAGLALQTAINFEQSNWQDIDWGALAKHQLAAKDINDIYYQCCQLALEIQRA